MSRTRILYMADRAALFSLKLIGALNILLVISLLAMLAVATGRARAEAPACTGRDMIADLERTDPAQLAEIRRQAATTLNGKGLLWKLEKAGQTPSFLFGTIHMTDPRVTSLTPAAQKAFDAAGTIVIETTDVLDQARMMATIMAEPDLTMFTDGTTLSSLLSPEDAAILAAGLDKRGIPLGSVAKMKPWMLSAMIALPACELGRKAGGAPVLDIKLAEDAKAGGKQLEGLETAVSQLRAMASLPIDLHMKSLVETLKIGDRMDDVVETMIVLYQSGDVAMYWPLFKAVLPNGGDDSGYAEFEEAMINSRNRLMVEHAEPILARGNSFIAVGALHLPGPNGLIELLRKDGYTATAVD